MLLRRTYASIPRDVNVDGIWSCKWQRLQRRKTLVFVPEEDERLGQTRKEMITRLVRHRDTTVEGVGKRIEEMYEGCGTRRGKAEEE